jgi:hypothetical protein
VGYSASTPKACPSPVASSVPTSCTQAASTAIHSAIAHSAPSTADTNMAGTICDEEADGKKNKASAHAFLLNL